MRPVRVPGRRGRDPQSEPAWCPAVPAGQRYLRHVRGEMPRWGGLGEGRDRLRLHVWSLDAARLSARVLLDIAGTASAGPGYYEQLETGRWPLTVGLAAPGFLGADPECWWLADPGGFVDIVASDGGRDVLQGVVVRWAAPLLTVVGVGRHGQTWAGLTWRAGQTREQVLAAYAEVAGAELMPEVKDVAGVALAVVLAGLLARQAGLVTTVELTTPSGEARWSCLSGELPVLDTVRSKPS